MEHYIIWLIVVIIAAVVEGMTMGLASIWFVPPGLIVLLLSLTGIPMWAQITIFVVLSVLSFVFLYPWAKKNMKLGQTKTNYEAVIGKNGVVLISINNMKAEGQVKVDGQIWSAKSSIEDVIIEAGKEVKILDVKGVKLICEIVKEV
jgi:membrane protein implicated in regulation of membrane protease activity